MLHLRSLIGVVWKGVREGEDAAGEFVGWEGAGEPVDGGAAFFHAAEPCHLALGELVDGDFQLAEHLFLGQLP